MGFKRVCVGSAMPRSWAEFSVCERSLGENVSPLDISTQSENYLASIV